MLRKLVLLAATAMVVPASLSAQSVGVAARVGSLGLGGEVAVGLSDRFQVRGGVGVIPREYEGTASYTDFTIRPSSPLGNVGVDVFMGNGAFRIGGGLMLISKETELTSEPAARVQVGSEIYDGADVGTLTGMLDYGSSAPYVVLGFGRGTGAGFSFFFDVGAAFIAEPSLTLTADGPLAQDPGQAGTTFRANLEQERVDVEFVARDYLEIFPIVSIGFRIPLM